MHATDSSNSEVALRLSHTNWSMLKNEFRMCITGLMWISWRLELQEIGGRTLETLQYEAGMKPRPRPNASQLDQLYVATGDACI